MSLNNTHHVQPGSFLYQSGQAELLSCSFVFTFLTSTRTNMHIFLIQKYLLAQALQLQDDNFHSLRSEQLDVGRFWYRFPTGESGADVFDRTKQWWETLVGEPRPCPGRSDMPKLHRCSPGTPFYVAACSPARAYTGPTIPNCNLHTHALAVHRNSGAQGTTLMCVLSSLPHLFLCRM